MNNPKVQASYSLENRLARQGLVLVAGIDEVGRGCLSGPLVACAVVLPIKCRLKLYDSKKISRSIRQQLSSDIYDVALAVGLGWVSNDKIDEFGLAWALREAYELALVDLEMPIHQIILDGSCNYLEDYKICQTIVSADSIVACVAAASIVAKVARDQYMSDLSDKYPNYGYQTNSGYGTALHRQAIRDFGLTDMHRKTFCKNIILD
ncbi:MAG: ribonuclease HII [Candidatus Saccharibacteria bacterium]